MESFFKTVRSNMIAQAVCSIVLGLVLALMPGVSTITIVYLLGVWLALAGAASLVAYFRSSGMRYHAPGVLANAVVLIVLAIIVFALPIPIAGFFALLLGILLLASGIVNIARAVELRGYAVSTAEWVLALVMGCIVAIGGLVVVVNPFGTTVLLVLMLGIMLVVKGITDLIVEWRISRALRGRGV